MINLPTAAALQQSVALTEDYMLLPIEAGFNWAEYFARFEIGEW